MPVGFFRVLVTRAPKVNFHELRRSASASK